MLDHFVGNSYLQELQGYSILGPILAAFIFGLNKAGLKGLGVVGILIMALVFGSKTSTGVVLPILMIGDVFAVLYYRRSIVWKYFFKLLPWIVVGVLMGVWIGNKVPEDVFKVGMAIIVLLSVLLLLFQERVKSEHIPEGMWFAGTMGIFAGIATMLGNLAGAFTNIYMLSMRVKKNEFIGTMAFLYFVVNIFKCPFHVFSWGTITWESLAFNIVLLPALIFGLFAGVWLVKKISDDLFRKIILILTALGALALLLQ